MLVRIYFVVALLGISSLPTFSQVMVGAGYTEAYFSDNVSEDANGIVLLVQKEKPLKPTSSWKIVGTSYIGLFTSSLNRKFSPSYTTTISFSPTISYRLIRIQRVILAPYVGVFTNWMIKYTAAEVQFESTTKNELHAGLEVGLSAYISINRKSYVKFIPLNFQYGNDAFVQGMITMAFVL